MFTQIISLIRTSVSTQTMLNRRQVRWVELLQGHNLTWFYKPGAQNPADGPSRAPVNEAPPDSVLVAVLTAQVPAVTKFQQVTDSHTFVDQVKAGYPQDPWFCNKANTSPLQFCNGLYFRGKAVAIPSIGDLRAEHVSSVNVMLPLTQHIQAEIRRCPCLHAIFGGLV